jgi:RNA polymerase sigma-70 factor (ECF subfamily)
MSKPGGGKPEDIRRWIKDSLNGNRSAQYALYKQYSKAMYNICYRITNREDEARDVLQEAFLQAFQKLHTFREESSFGAWLKRIVIHQAINHLRKQRLLYQPLEDHHDLPDDDPQMPKEEIDFEVSRIREAVQQLPDGFRTVFSLYLLEGYDHAEIGQIMGISESTSKTQYIRAKKRLREILKGGISSNG